MEKEKFYLTTAIAYASQKPHIGNVYEIILADTIARYKKQRGYDVYLCTGTDEHGQKIEDLAQKKGVTPKAYVDDISGEIERIWRSMNTSFDRFIRTTDDFHIQCVQKLFKQLYDQGDIYKDKYEGWYCVPCESFFTETQAKDGLCPDCGRPVKRTEEEAYFFKMSRYADQLMEHIEKNPGFIEPESRKKEMINNFLKPGLQDLCVSRSSFKWGIPVSFDDKHVIYVWIDALSNYITALGYDKEQPGENFKKYWPCDVHIVGKDIMRFHTIYWPIILMALGLPLPKKIFGHGWLNFGSDKMSKSKGNVIYSDDLLPLLGVDGIRHYVLSEMPYAADGSITYEAMISRYNTDLANNLGNLVNRTAAMTKKYFGSVIPAPGVGTEFDEDLKETAHKTAVSVQEKLDSYHVADALEEVFSLFRRANKYIDETAPWALAKEEANKARLETVIYNLLETIRIGAVLMSSFLPESAEKILTLLGGAEAAWDSAFVFGTLVPGSQVGEPVVLFARLDEEAVLADIQAKKQAKDEPAEKEKPEGLAQISIDQFMQVELRSAQIIACEPVPRAKKLLKLQVDLGYETRQIVSGIAAFYGPDDLIGKKVIVVANLAPAKLCDVESQGMLLAAGEDPIRVVFLDPETPNGERVR
ncbi:MAG: methionine--tRNA ligase [Clostridiales bacterium]|nr:methionine--tRNA ligase [Clostridiales bacterium]